VRVQLCVLKVHDDSPVEVRPEEGPSRLCSSPSASGEIRALKRGVTPSLGGCNPPVRSMKRSLPRREPSPKGSNGEPSPELQGEGHGRGEALGDAAPRNPAAYGARNGGTAVVGTGETRLCPGSETPGVPPQAVDRERRAR
jgi:hypothetical protein